MGGRSNFGGSYSGIFHHYMLYGAHWYYWYFSAPLMFVMAVVLLVVFKVVLLKVMVQILYRMLYGTSAQYYCTGYGIGGGYSRLSAGTGVFSYEPINGANSSAWTIGA